jgi:octaprenyl-diphosphate synthase
MAFQIVDDVLDLTASEEVLGKPVASDLREGKATLAVINALERCTTSEHAQIQKILTDRAFNGVSHADILAILEKYSALNDAMDDAIRYAEAARDNLEGFPDNDYKRALLWVPSFVVGREK